MPKGRRRRPSNGVIVFSTILIIIGTISFLSIMISFFQLRLQLQFKDDAPALFSQLPNFTINFTVFWLSTVLSSIIMFCWIVSGIGALLLKEWARQLLLVSIGIYFLNKLVDIFINISIIEEHVGRIPVASLVIGILFVLILTVSITYFFTHPRVIAQFNRGRRGFH
ncbi:hypothetical protein ACFL2J_02295 [Candidatus Omnitrophota bacterium]